MATLWERRRGETGGSRSRPVGRRRRVYAAATFVRSSFKRGELQSNRGMGTIYRVLDGLRHKCMPQQR